jgi:O-antigen/teichoic acid export membrane protein
VLLLFALAGAGLAAVLRAAPELLVRWVYGVRYLPTAAWVSALAPFLLFLSPGIFAATILAARGRSALLCAILLAPLAAQAVANLLLFPRHVAAVVPVSIGFEGIAAVTAIVFSRLSPSRADRS